VEKLYVGVNLHKRSCWVTVLDADSHLLESRRIGTTKPGLLEFFGQVRKPAAVPSLSRSGSYALAGLTVLLVWIGVYPGPFLEAIQRAVSTLRLF